jgi:hypothetical protein
MIRINLLQLALQISFGKLFYLKTPFGCIFCLIMSSTTESQRMEIAIQFYSSSSWMMKQKKRLK